ncbi:MAG TPA: hypothetical protein VF624_17095 [Tepidisphaeraceae bacterium]
MGQTLKRRLLWTLLVCALAVCSYLVWSAAAQRKYDVQGGAFAHALQGLFRRPHEAGDRAEVGIESFGADVLVYLGGYSSPDEAIRSVVGDAAFKDLDGFHAEEGVFHWVRAGRVVASVTPRFEGPLNATSHHWRSDPDRRFRVALRKVAPGPNPFYDIAFE